MTTTTCRSCRFSYAIANEYGDALLACNPGGHGDYQLACKPCPQYEREIGADEPEGGA